jgi:hypothetical protein
MQLLYYSLSYRNEVNISSLGHDIALKILVLNSSFVTSLKTRWVSKNVVF